MRQKANAKQKEQQKQMQNITETFQAKHTDSTKANIKA